MSFSPSILVRLFSKDPDDLHSFGSLSSGANTWLAKNATINEEIQDIMVDVAFIFSLVPQLQQEKEIALKWNSAFEQLFALIKGLRKVMDTEDTAPSGTFEGRQDRHYLAIEAEYFLTCFFHEFYEMLAKTDKLGSLCVELAWAEPTDDLFAVYRYVQEVLLEKHEKPQRKRKSGSSSHRPSVMSEMEILKLPDGEIQAEIKAYLDSLMDAGSDTESSARNLMEIAKHIDAHSDSSVHRFFSSFRKREFGKLYKPVRNTVNGEILVDVLAKYYREYVADPRMFNAPSYEVIVKDIMRDSRCDS